MPEFVSSNFFLHVVQFLRISLIISISDNAIFYDKCFFVGMVVFSFWVRASLREYNLKQSIYLEGDPRSGERYTAYYFSLFVFASLIGWVLVIGVLRRCLLVANHFHSDTSNCDAHSYW